MNKDQIEGNWTQFKGKVREAWGNLTDDDIALYKGKKDQFFGKLQEKHGVAREEAEERMRKFEKDCNYCNDAAA